MAWGAALLEDISDWGYFLQIKKKNACLARVLPYCTNRRTTVPMYADAFGLFVFGAFLTSISLSKMTFLTDWNIPGIKYPGYLHN